jgi:DNA polymerase-3 subunit delta
MDGLKRDLAAGKILPVYVFVGTEELTKREAVDAVCKAALDGPRDFNETRLIWKETNGDQIVDACSTLPMMGRRRLVVVSGIEAAKGKQLGPVAKYLANPSPTTTLVLVGSTVDLRGAVYKAAKKVGLVEKCDPPYANKLPSWIQARARSRSIRIDPDAAALLGDIVGTDLAGLDESLERLTLYVSKPDTNTHITQSDVEACIARTRTHTVFELTDAVGRRQPADAIRILEAMLHAREAPIAIVAMVGRHIRRLWTASEALDAGESTDAIGSSMRIHKFFLRDFLRQARMFHRGEYAWLLSRIYQTDKALKSSRAPSEMHMHRLILELCTSAKH